MNNYITNPTDILDAFPISDTAFGSNINFTNQLEKWIKLTPGSYNSLITLTDQNFNTINMLDSNVLISLIITYINK